MVERVRLRVGLLTPHAAAGPDIELPRMASGRLTTVLERVYPPDPDDGTPTPPPTGATGLRALTRPAVLDGPAARLGDGSVDVVAHASTTSGYALGHRAEAAMVGRLRDLCGVPVVTSGCAAVHALQAGGARRVALVHPPWFEDELDELGVSYFRELGFDVRPAKATGLPDDPKKIRRRSVVDWVCRHIDDEADAVFIAGTGFRAADSIEELERRTGQLVLEANQVLLWSVLAATRTEWEVAGYGRLFRAPEPETGMSTTTPSQSSRRMPS